MALSAPRPRPGSKVSAADEVRPCQRKVIDVSPSTSWENSPSKASSVLRSLHSAFRALTTGRSRFSSISATV